MKHLYERYYSVSTNQIKVEHREVSFGLTEADYCDKFDCVVTLDHVNICNASRFPQTMYNQVDLLYSRFPFHWIPPERVARWWNAPFCTFDKFLLPKKADQGVNVYGVRMNDQTIEALREVDTPLLRVLYDPVYTCMLAGAKAKSIRVLWRSDDSPEGFIQHNIHFDNVDVEDAFTFQERLFAAMNQ